MVAGEQRSLDSLSSVRDEGLIKKASAVIYTCVKCIAVACSHSIRHLRLTVAAVLQGDT